MNTYWAMMCANLSNEPLTIQVFKKERTYWGVKNGIFGPSRKVLTNSAFCYQFDSKCDLGVMESCEDNLSNLIKKLNEFKENGIKKIETQISYEVPGKSIERIVSKYDHFCDKHEELDRHVLVRRLPLDWAEMQTIKQQYNGKVLDIIAREEPFIKGIIEFDSTLKAKKVALAEDPKIA